MPFKGSLRGSFQICAMFLAIFGLMRDVHGQQRIFAKVEPNAASINSSADIFDPVSGTFSPSAGSMTTERRAPSASLLFDGTVLIAGGYNGTSLSTAELYNPSSRRFTATTGTMNEARSGHTATVLLTGRVLLTGGFNGASYSITGELYDPSTQTFSTGGSMTTYRSEHTATLLNDGKVLIVGGYSGTSYLLSAELYDPGTGIFTATTGTLNGARKGHTATLLSDGRVLVTGGEDSNGYLSTAEIFDESTGKFTVTTGPMTAARFGHAAALTSNGKVLIAGGYNGSYLNTAEIFDPSTGKFTATTGTMSAARRDLAAVSLLSGKILISGGYNGAFLNSAELFDPSAGTFSAVTSTLSAPRQLATAILLSSGAVLIAGGQSANLLIFDTNQDQTDNISPNILFSSDSKTGYAAYPGSGIIIAFSTQTGKIIQKLATGGYPCYGTPLADGKTIAYVSALLDNRIFLVDMASLQLQATYTFANAQFGFGSILILSADGQYGYVSSTGTGQVIRFTTADGKETARWNGLQAPCQLTLSKDGGTLMVVDASSDEVDFADSTTMVQKNSFKPKTQVTTADLTMYHKVVLTNDGVAALIVANDLGGTLVNGHAFIFRVSDATSLATESTGVRPGFAALQPIGQNWVVLNSDSLSLIPTYDPNAAQNLPTAQGNPLGSANLVFSPDSRYVFYTSAAKDFVYQHDLGTLGVVGQVQVGDYPDKALEEPGAVAMTPDGKIVAAVEVISNNIDLLTSAPTLESPKYVVSGSQFSGISLVNLSPNETTVTLTALDNYGQTVTATNLVNPATVVLAPNAQFSGTIGQIFNFDLTTDHLGRLEVQSDQSQIAGYMTIGQVAPTWFGYYMNRLDGIPLFRKPVSDMVIPEIGSTSGTVVQLNFVNPNFTQQKYDLNQYAKDGTLLQSKLTNIAYPTNREEHAFTDLFSTSTQDKVLITGGVTSTTYDNTTETYSVSGRTFTATAVMTSARAGHTATLLYNGKVLAAGGKDAGNILNTAETYDITANTFAAAAGNMVNARYRHTATLLPSGKVLMAGGQNATSVNSTAETYDPTAGTFTATTGPMTAPRDSHTATLLPSGKVLLAGGINGNTVTNTAEIYDPATDKFTATGSMLTGRAFHTATLLTNGKVLVTGGYNGAYLNTAEIYDPSTGTFRATTGSMNARRNLHTATLVADGTVVITGGADGTTTLSSLEIYDPATDKFTAVVGTMLIPRKSHTATLLSNGKVLLDGGNNGTNDLSSAEEFDPTTGGLQTAAGAMTAARSGHAATYLVAGNEGYLRVTCVVGGLNYSEFYGATTDIAALNGIELQKYVGITTLYSPQFANVPAFRTLLSLIDTNPDSDALVTVILHDASGKVLATSSPLSVPRNGKIQMGLNDIFVQTSAIQNTSGWLEIRSTVDRVVGTITFTDDNTITLTAFELMGTPLNHFIYPIVAEDGTYHTGIALLNHNDTDASVTMELWGGDGSLVQSKTLTIAPGNRTALYLSDFFPGMGESLAGHVRIRSSVPLYSLSLIHDTAMHFIAAVPAIQFPN